MGLRELKKQRTRKAISDLATQLFIERGYDNVTTSEIAELAEISVPTLFKYFPTKESLVFDEESEIEEWLVSTVENRKKGQSVLEALLQAGLARMDDVPESHKGKAKIFMNMVKETPELSHYASQMWMRHEKTLAGAIRKGVKAKLSQVEAETVARFVLDSYYRAMEAAHSKAALKAMFKILKDGWGE